MVYTALELGLDYLPYWDELTDSDNTETESDTDNTDTDIELPF